MEYSLLKKIFSTHSSEDIKEICQSFFEMKKMIMNDEILNELIAYIEERIGNQEYKKLYANDNSKVYLSAREWDCIKWYAKGKNSAEISTILEISQRTIETHIEKAKLKLGCTNLFQLGYYIAKLRFNVYGFVPHPYK